MAWIPEQNAVWARQVYQDLKKRGLDAEAAIKVCDIGRASLFKKDGTITFEKHCALFGYAAQITGEDCYGLHMGARMDPKDAGLLGYIGLSSANLQDTLQNLARYSKIGTEGLELHLSVDDDLARFEAALTLTLTPQGYDQEIEFSISLLVQACRIFTGRYIAPLEVQFLHHREKNIGKFRRVFGCPVTFGHNRERVLFKRETLLLPIVSADDRLLDILKSYGDDILVERSKRGPNFQHLVERRIVELLPRGEANIKIIAMEFGMSERTLSRRLADLGMTFKELLADVRRDLSLKYVTEPNVNLKQAAFLLGYSEVSAFSHAFKRWTGETPARMRQVAIGG